MEEKIQIPKGLQQEARMGAEVLVDRYCMTKYNNTKSGKEGSYE